MDRTFSCYLATTVADPSFEQEPSVEQSQCVTVPFWKVLGLRLTYDCGCICCVAIPIWEGVSHKIKPRHGMLMASVTMAILPTSQHSKTLTKKRLEYVKE